ncbi:MAG: inositol monophosphatase family protein [Tsuneonella sp.]
MSAAAGNAALDSAIAALVRKASAEIIMPRYRNLAAGEVFEKLPNELVTVADRESEALLSEGLARLDSSLAIVGEEAVPADPAVLDRLKGPCWIIDPIDGTANFAAGRPHFGVLVARCEDRRAVSGWIYDCLTDRFCSAHRGQGAFLGGERVTARTSGKQPPVAAISKLYVTPDQARWMEANIEPEYELVEIPRCAAEQYPRLALGQNDVSSFNRIMPWDHAAGVLWLNEAGGRAARYDGSEYLVDDYETRGLLAASSPAIWDDFIALIRPVLREAAKT